MAFLKTKGIIIKEHNTTEADKSIVILTPYQGKISVWVKGARRTKNPMAGRTQLFNYCDFSLYKSGDNYSLNNCDIIESFKEIKDDIDLIYYGAHFADIMYELSEEGIADKEAITFFLNALYMLTKDKERAKIVTRIFEMRILAISGFMPVVEGCNSCGSEDNENMYFDFLIPGFACEKCKSEDSIKLLPGTVNSMKYIYLADIKSVFSFKVSDEVLEQLQCISKRLIKIFLEKDFDKLDILEDLF